MRVAVIGAGPAGLYFSYLLKRAMPAAQVTVFEQRLRGVTFGFGIVFSDKALNFLVVDDPETHSLLEPELERWSDLTVVHRGERIVIDGIGFAAIGRQRLLELLVRRAEGAGASIEYECAIEDLAQFRDADLIVGADGVNSLVRQGQSAGFGCETGELSNRFIWYGTEIPFDTLTQTFKDTPLGPFNAHHYRYTASASTFIVETTEEVWQRAGFEMMDEDECRKTCEAIFADVLQGASLISNESRWRRFPIVRNRQYHSGNAVLLGDALHTAHFSIGSGTRLALEDAIALARNIAAQPSDLVAALAAYQDERSPILDKLLSAADASAAWYQAFDEYMALEPHEFAMSYINRSGRIDPARLKAMSPGFVAAYEAVQS